VKTVTHHLTRITMIAAVAAAGFTTHAADAAPNGARVVRLPAVVVTATRIPLAQPEPVAITARRVAPARSLVAQRLVPARSV
jgi:hypothetical protein